jgi:radical SAM protein with 4Fe4S-binding SPASM domain
VKNGPTAFGITRQICRPPAESGGALPCWAQSCVFISTTRTSEELSIVCPESLISDGVKSDRGWRSLKVEGPPLDFSLTGVLASLLSPLAEAGKSKKPYAILELINFPDIYKDSGRRQRKEFLEHFRRLPLDRTEVKEMHNWAGEISGPRKGKKYSPCTFLWQALIIFWDGAVLPCTQDFFGYYTLGNVKDVSLAEIWNNDKMIRLRKKILEGDIEDLETCSECDRLWREQFLGVPREYLWKFLLKRMP